MVTLTLYGRPDCGLCDEMADAIENQFGERVNLRKHDITGDDRLEHRFGLKIPVLVLDDELICYGHLDSVRLKQALDTLD